MFNLGFFFSSQTGVCCIGICHAQTEFDMPSFENDQIVTFNYSTGPGLV